MAYQMTELDKLDLELMAAAMTPPCTAGRNNTLTGAHLANIAAMRNGGSPVAVVLPSTMELPAGMTLEAFMEQLMAVTK